jgi:hypothetical protein
MLGAELECALQGASGANAWRAERELDGPESTHRRRSGCVGEWLERSSSSRITGACGNSRVTLTAAIVGPPERASWLIRFIGPLRSAPQLGYRVLLLRLA